MYLKSTLLAISICITGITQVNASSIYTHNEIKETNAIGTVQNISKVENFWYEYNNDERALELLARKGVHGLQYIKMTDDTVTEGISIVGADDNDMLPDNWTVIFYLATSTMYDRSVFAYNNNDGTATIYDPGESPF